MYLIKSSRIKSKVKAWLNPYLKRKQERVLAPYLKDKSKVLDVGCGIFMWQNVLDTNVKYLGIDAKADIVEYNKKHYSHKFEQFDLEKDDWNNLGKGYDIVIMLELLEYLQDPRRALCRFSDVLKNEGIICLTTPHASRRKISNLIRRKKNRKDLIDYKKISSFCDKSGYELMVFKNFIVGYKQFVVLKKKV